MNILEALELVKAGKIIRYVHSDEETMFVLQTTLHPIGEKEIIMIEITDIRQMKKKPLDLKDVDYSTNPSICIKALESKNYKEVSIEEMTKEIQEYWELNNN